MAHTGAFAAIRASAFEQAVFLTRLIEIAKTAKASGRFGTMTNQLCEGSIDRELFSR
jgi:hypothetical protein